MGEWMNGLGLRWRALWKRGQLDRDLEDEVAFHLAMKREKAGGPEDPRVGFGNPTRIKEQVREQWSFPGLESIWQDVRYAARMLMRTPAFTLVAVASLAIGIGANTAIFSLVDSVLIKSLPVSDPSRLRLLLWSGEPRVPLNNSSGYNTRVDGVMVHSSFSYPMYRTLAANLPQFSDLLGFAHSQLTVTGRPESHYASGWFVTGNFFSGLGVHALAGRELTPEDDRPAAPTVGVISYRYWSRQFALDPEAIGRDLTVNGQPVTIVGVLPESFTGVELGRQYDLFLPIARSGAFAPKWYALEKSDSWWVQVLGRLKPGVSDQAARTALQAVMDQEASAYPAKPEHTRDPWRALLKDGSGGVFLLRLHATTPLLILQCVVGLVLLIACANIANLLLARGSARRREIAVRLSIGAGRFRLVRQILTESLLLACLGAGLGLLIAVPLAKGVMAMAGGNEKIILDPHVDVRALLFTATVAILTALLFGLIPALRATRLDLTPALKDGTFGTAGLGRHFRLSRVLVAGQVALSTLLLAGAVLFTRTLVQVSSIDPGFNARRLLLFDLDGTRSGYGGEKTGALYERVRSRLETIPGVEAVMASSSSLIAGDVSNDDLTIAGYTPKNGPAMAYTLAVSPHFVSGMGIGLLLGRDIADRDTLSAPKVAVVNEAFVRTYLEGRSPVGVNFHFGTDPVRDAKGEFEIVGVCRNAKYDNLKNETPPTVYFSYVQNPKWIRDATFEVRTTLPPVAIASAVRRAVAEIDRGVPIAEMRTQEEQIRASLGMERLFAALVGSFGLTAALLAAIGLYGVMAYAVSRRTAEIGLRLALGARAGSVQWMVLRDSLRMVVVGMAIGIPAAFALSRLVRSLLFGVSPGDPGTYVASGLLMLAVAALAAWLPARRAASVDPMRALRCE